MGSLSTEHCSSHKADLKRYFTFCLMGNANHRSSEKLMDLRNIHTCVYELYCSTFRFITPSNFIIVKWYKQRNGASASAFASRKPKHHSVTHPSYEEQLEFCCLAGPVFPREREIMDKRWLLLKFPPSFTFKSVLQNWHFKIGCMVTKRWHWRLNNIWLLLWL